MECCRRRSRRRATTTQRQEVVQLTASQGGSRDRPARLGNATSVVITVGALGVALAHAIWPALEIDATTLGLLAAAAVPWLLPVIKQVKVGNVEILLREVRDEVQEVRNEVQELATQVNFMFSGEIAPTQQKQHQDDLTKFVNYLRRIDLPADDRTRIHVGRPSDSRFPEAYNEWGTYYEPDTHLIVVGTRLATDVAAIYREYMHHVLEAAAPELAQRYRGSDRFRVAIGGLWHGLLDYFPCSFRDTPLVRGPAQPDAEIRGPASLANARSFPSSMSNGDEHDLGEIWGGCFWELRGPARDEVVDRSIARAWKSVNAAKVPAVLNQFVQSLAQELEGAGRPREGTIHVFRDRNLRVDATSTT